MTNSEWLTPFLKDIQEPEDLKEINILHTLRDYLDTEKQIALEKLAPEKLEVTATIQIKPLYQSTGEPPKLPIELIHAFALQDTPRINEGKTPVLLHLLSPDLTLIHTTTDLRGFWSDVYPGLKEELKRKYSVLEWPDQVLVSSLIPNPFPEEKGLG